MAKIQDLLSEEFMSDYLRAKVLPLYAQAKKIENFEIIPRKEYIWGDEWYHVVIEYKITFLNKDDKEFTKPIFCSAHWEEPRRNVYTALKYLWKNGFNEEHLTIPHPLFYSQQFRGVFYEGIEGRNLYKFIREEKIEDIRRIVPQAAEWFAKLHQSSILGARNFNKQNSRIKTVIPGTRHILESIKHKTPDSLDFFKEAYRIFVKKEEASLKKINLTMVHGDAHPENIIVIDKERIGVIDFTDLSLSDFARDLGTFMQQIEFMCQRKISVPNFSNDIKEEFLKKYLKYAKIDLDDDLQSRINNYYNWTKLRTATYFLIKSNPEPERGHILVEELKNNLNL